MARAKDSPAGPTKTARSAGTKSPGSRATQARKPAAPAPDAPSVETLARADGESPSPEQLYRMIQETAYYKAKARNFAPGHEVQDWIEAEAEVRRRIESRA
jgi:hypothetical protein